MNKTYTISFNHELAEVVEKEKKNGKFGNTSEFFRQLVRQNFLGEDLVIERLDPSDPDAIESKRRAKTEKFIPWSQVKKKLKMG